MPRYRYVKGATEREVLRTIVRMEARQNPPTYDNIVSRLGPVPVEHAGMSLGVRKPADRRIRDGVQCLVGTRAVLQPMLPEDWHARMGTEVPPYAVGREPLYWSLRAYPGHPALDLPEGWEPPSWYETLQEVLADKRWWTVARDGRTGLKDPHVLTQGAMHGVAILGALSDRGPLEGSLHARLEAVDAAMRALLQDYRVALVMQPAWYALGVTDPLPESATAAAQRGWLWVE